MPDAPRTRILVEEQFDHEGDLIYTVCLTTYSREAIRRLEVALDVELVWRTPLRLVDEYSVKVPEAPSASQLRLAAVDGRTIVLDGNGAA